MCIQFLIGGALRVFAAMCQFRFLVSQQSTSRIPSQSGTQISWTSSSYVGNVMRAWLLQAESIVLNLRTHAALPAFSAGDHIGNEER